ncbi:MAG: MFS transporter, partial [Candidatus Methanofastidiosia archaeon]
MNKKNILLISSAAHAYTHACMLSIPPLVLLLKEEFSLSFTLISLAITSSGLLFGVGALPFGILSDKMGALKVNFFGIILAIVSTLGLYRSSNIYVFVFFLLLLGIASSTYHPSAFNLISCLFTNNTGRAFGINGIIGNIGQISSPLFSAFIAYNFGWRYVFLLLSAAGIIIALSFLPIINYKIEYRPVKIKEKFHINKDILLILIITMVGGLAYRGVTTMLPAYASIIYLKNTFSAGSLVTMMLASGGIAQLISGEINDRYGSIKPLTIAAFAMVVSVIVIMIGNYTTFLLGLVAFGFTYFAVNLFTNSIIAKITPQDYRGTFYGMMFFARFGLGFIAPLMVGFVSDIYSIKYLFHIVVVFLILYFM